MKSKSAKRGNEEANIAISLLKQKRRAEAITHFNTALDQFEAIEDERERKTELSVFASVLDIVGFPELLEDNDIALRNIPTDVMIFYDDIKPTCTKDRLAEPR
jgi:hypothetical protein